MAKETEIEMETEKEKETVSVSNLFTIRGYSAAKGIGIGEYISSEEFTVGGYKWAIVLYPDGKSPEDNSSYVSVYVALVSDGTDVQAMFHLTLVDQTGKGRHKIHSFFNKPNTLRQRLSMWGFKRYLKRCVFEKSDYLRDDCVKFYCTVGVVGSGIDSTPTRSCSVKETARGSKLFVIDGYSLAQGIGVGNHVASNEFWSGGHKWAIYFYPVGRDDSSSSYASLFVKLMSDGTDVKARFELMLMDQSGKGKHKLLNVFNKPSTLKCRGTMWGGARPFSRDMDGMTDYLRDDCFKIYCNVEVIVSAVDRSMIRVPDSDMGSHIGMLLRNAQGFDISFNVRGVKFHAHRLILTARSPKLIQQHAEYIDPDMEPQVFKALLQFIYADGLAEDDEVIASETLTAKLLAAAHHYCGFNYASN